MRTIDSLFSMRIAWISLWPALIAAGLLSALWGPLINLAVPFWLALHVGFALAMTARCGNCRSRVKLGAAACSRCGAPAAR